MTKLSKFKKWSNRLDTIHINMYKNKSVESIETTYKFVSNKIKNIPSSVLNNPRFFKLKEKYYWTIIRQRVLNTQEKIDSFYKKSPINRKQLLIDFESFVRPSIELIDQDQDRLDLKNVTYYLSPSERLAHKSW